MIVVLRSASRLAWYAIEIAHDIRATVFQPFRMAPWSAGSRCVLISGRLVALWRPAAD